MPFNFVHIYVTLIQLKGNTNIHEFSMQFGHKFIINNTWQVLRHMSSFVEILCLVIRFIFLYFITMLWDAEGYKSNSTILAFCCIIEGQELPNHVWEIFCVWLNY